MKGKLFTRDFLLEGITRLDPWEELTDDEVDRFVEAARKAFARVAAAENLNEAVTEDLVILPILDLLGWPHRLRQQSAAGRGRSDVPDILLFGDADAEQRALGEARDADRYRHGSAVLESKRWQRPLDRGEATDRLDPGVPANQMLRYLSIVETASDGAIVWGILTNGRHWRLYYQKARARADEFLEVDLERLLAATDTGQSELFEAPHRHVIKLFLLLFARTAFEGEPSLLQRARAESHLWERKVSEDLGSRVFGEMFPALLNELAQGDPERRLDDQQYLEDLRDAALILLYRLLFVLYAEDRNLLPVDDRRYDEYALRRIRQDIVRRLNEGDTFASRGARYWLGMQDLFSVVDRGDDAIGIPPYNGGLFDAAGSPILERAELPDARFVPILDGLSRADIDGSRRWINYSDLSVQQLGSIYERLLEYRILVEGDRLVLAPGIYARKGSGSYYTPEPLVQLIIERTVGPLVTEQMTAFEEAAMRLGSSRKRKPERMRELRRLDPAAAILSLKICDPACGSGHFLVSLVDYLADAVLESMARAEESVTWADAEEPYQSPLLPRIEAIRGQILDNAREHGWLLEAGQLDDHHIVRRMILKRVVHGVDKNPMAVELAKLSLWLNSFTVGAPLSFLDHHLICGDSLFGEWIETVVDELSKMGAMFQHSELTRIASAANAMGELADLADTDIAEVRHSAELFHAIREELAPVRRLMDFWHGLRWLDPDRKLVDKQWLRRMAKKEKKEPESKSDQERRDEARSRALGDLLSGRSGNLFEVLSNPSGIEQASVREFVEEVLDIVDRERFLHWEVAFPLVWHGLEEGVTRGGFDAVIGNPPWDRMKLQQVEWFAERRPEIARQARAADRKKRIAALEETGDDLWHAYEAARWSAETAADVARTCGQYPLLARGDINLYTLFIERAERLLHGRGIAGLLVPSGIAADKSSSVFFSGIATGGRLSALLDFENKKVFFPDVHASFKFSVFIFGGVLRRIGKAQCAFFLHDVSTLNDTERAFTLTPQDFALVNPNTGTAPIFRTRRDAAITTEIYRKFPVLVDRRDGQEIKSWPVRYMTMFHMTNDSHLFKTRTELAVDSFYPVELNHWKRGDERVVPLYEGKMVQAYDHRAASVQVNVKNVNRPAQAVPATVEQKSDPCWLPEPQFWLPHSALEGATPSAWLGFKDVTAPTNMRTMIAAMIPLAGLGNTLPALACEQPRTQAMLLANLNSFCYDYLARQKVQGQHLNWFIVEQLPVISAAAYEREIGTTRLADFVIGEVLHLTCTAIDMEPFARELGYKGGPFVWDDEDRRHRMARLDALYFHLYEVSRDDAAYILDQFPIVARQDQEEFGRFLTKDLVLAYYNAIAAGDLATRVNI